MDLSVVGSIYLALIVLSPNIGTCILTSVFSVSSMVDSPTCSGLLSLSSCLHLFLDFLKIIWIASLLEISPILWSEPFKVFQSIVMTVTHDTVIQSN